MGSLWDVRREQDSIYVDIIWLWEGQLKRNGDGHKWQVNRRFGAKQW